VTYHVMRMDQMLMESGEYCMLYSALWMNSELPVGVMPCMSLLQKNKVPVVF
jgi:hypothetical protein